PSLPQADCEVSLSSVAVIGRGASHHWEALVMLSLRINGKTYSVDVERETPLLWVIRDTIGLTGTKYGCGMGLCGACTVHVNGKAVRACSQPVSQAAGKDVTTIEGLSPNAQHPLQIAWREGDVPECGYCQPGQIMAAAALLAKNSKPTDADITREVTNLCRCGTYPRIRQAIHRAAELAAKKRRATATIAPCAWPDSARAWARTATPWPGSTGSAGSTKILRQILRKP